MTGASEAKEQAAGVPGRVISGGNPLDKAIVATIMRPEIMDIWWRSSMVVAVGTERIRMVYEPLRARE